MSKKTRIDFQKWLIAKGCFIGNSGADGIVGKATKEAAYKLFSDLKAKAITNQELEKIAQTIGDTTGTARIRAVADCRSIRCRDPLKHAVARLPAPQTTARPGHSRYRQPPGRSCGHTA